MTEKELILTSMLGLSRSELYLNKVELNPKQSDLFNSLTKRRIKGEPLQYLLGETEFMGLKFKTDKRALIPRPETEVLVEETLKLSVGKKIENILDIGTGSGNIAVSLAKFLTQVKITAVDISQGALELAKENAVFNQVDKQISFLKCDICSEEFWGGLERFDLIISNPPYIKSSDLPNLPLDVQFEPQIALDAGSDGLKFYRAIIRKAERLLNKSGLLALEIGLGQKEQLIEILNEKFEALKIIKDYNSIDRVIIARLV